MLHSDSRGSDSPRSHKPKVFHVAYWSGLVLSISQSQDIMLYYHIASIICLSHSINVLRDDQISGDTQSKSDMHLNAEIV